MTKEKTIKEHCHNCNRAFTNIDAHRKFHCKHRFDNLIGPLPNLIKCNICNYLYYEHPVYRIKLSYKKQFKLFTEIPYYEHSITCANIDPNNKYRDFIKDELIVPYEKIDEYSCNIAA